MAQTGWQKRDASTATVTARARQKGHEKAGKERRKRGNTARRRERTLTSDCPPVSGSAPRFGTIPQLPWRGLCPESSGGEACYTANPQPTRSPPGAAVRQWQKSVK